MANYARPDVYVEEILTGEKPIQATATSIGAFIGRTPRGKEGEVVSVTSWTDYINKFALGCESPFLANSDLPNAVFGFFQNGGSHCKIIRVVPSTATASKIALASEGLEVQAKEVGEWANERLGVKVVANSTNFNVQVYVGNELVETLENLSNTEGDNHFITVINETSKYIKVDPGTDKSLVATSGIVKLKGGDDAVASINNTDYINALNKLDVAEDINLVAIPGVSSEEAVGKALVEYCDGRNDCFAIIDCKAKTVDDAKTFREAIGGTNGAVYFPYGKIVDPLGRTSSSLKSCPPSGHVMGIYARVDTNRGVYKAPAGEDCIVRGFVALDVTISKTELAILNPLGVNCIVAKPNKGILLWGARSLSADPSKRYISDVRYDIYIRTSVYEGTQWAIFEPNDSDLWEKISTSLTSFLDAEWRSGALRGDSADEAYYVKCDSELNTEDTINNGQLIAEIGYAKQKPSEFVIVKIVQKQEEA